MPKLDRSRHVGGLNSDSGTSGGQFCSGQTGGNAVIVGRFGRDGIGGKHSEDVATNSVCFR